MFEKLAGDEGGMSGIEVVERHDRTPDRVIAKLIEVQRPRRDRTADPGW